MKDERKTDRLVVSISPSLKQALRRRAAERHITMSALTRWMLSCAVDNLPPPTPVTEVLEAMRDRLDQLVQEKC